MSAVRRPNSRSLLLDLTRRLAEEFESLPIPTVTTAVQSAVNATDLFGDNVVESIDTIERIAREDLLAVSAAAAEQAQVALAS